jgi:proline dehydrogenase
VLSRLIASSLPLIPRPIVFRVARRYVAGVTLRDAISTDRALAAAGLRSTTTLLGEHLHDPARVEAVVNEFFRLLEALQLDGLEGGISVKPTHVGLAIDPELCRDSLDRLAAEAQRRGRFLRIDMEDHSTTDVTLAIYRDLRQRHHNVGVVLQAYLKRTLDDIEALPLDSSVRLCKGIYVEPEPLVVGGFGEVRANYLRALDLLLARGTRVALATHDGWELQMLLGVAPQLRQRLAAEGRRIRVYVPYGPEWYDYSLRRLRENPRIAMHVVRAMFGRS